MFVSELLPVYQSRLESIIEVLLNSLIGYAVALVSQLIIFPLVGIDVSLQTNLIIGLYFTVVSIARSYILRRFFNRKIKQAAIKMSHRLY